MNTKQKPAPQGQYKHPWYKAVEKMQGQKKK
jgi:hypothetical protein